MLLLELPNYYYLGYHHRQVTAGNPLLLLFGQSGIAHVPAIYLNYPIIEIILAKLCAIPTYRLYNVVLPAFTFKIGMVEV